MSTETPDGTPTTASPPVDPLLAEDLLLVLFDPASGTIAAEGTLYYLLGGAVLTQLAIDGHVESQARDPFRGPLVTALDGPPPSDPLLAAILDDHLRSPSGAQAFIAAIGPTLREQLLDRLVARGEVDRERGRVLGVIPSTRLHVSPTGRRSTLVERIRAVLVDGEAPDARTRALIAILSAGGTLVSLHREVPWTGAVATRAAQLARGDLGADAAGEAVTRTTNAILAATLAAITVLPKP